jgi:ribonuclease D
MSEQEPLSSAKRPTQLRYVHKAEDLPAAIRALEAAPWAAVDTEADSLHHYVEKLCLLQVSIPEGDFVIDPLAGMDLQPYIDVLVTKHQLLHGADFDLRMIKRFFRGAMPFEIFDTMLGAQLLGYVGQGYADLANRHCGVTLSKASQKADWSRRPLDDKLLDYAANDTHYLRMIVDKMTEELKACGRLEWHRQACARLVRSVTMKSSERVEDGREWQMKGSKELRGLSLTILKSLWYWRDEKAKKRDRPSFKVLNGDTLIDIAKWAVSNPGADVSQMPKAPSPVRYDYRDELNRLIKEAETLPPAEFKSGPKIASKKRWAEKENRKLAALKKVREEVSTELKIHASLIATNAILETIAVEMPANSDELARLDCLMPWQIEIAGELLVKAAATP